MGQASWTSVLSAVTCKTHGSSGRGREHPFQAEALGAGVREGRTWWEGKRTKPGLDLGAGWQNWGFCTAFLGAPQSDISGQQL